VALRLDRLELRDRYTATAEAAGAAGRATLERRVCSLEGRMAAGGSQAARKALAEVAALTWRVDRVRKGAASRGLLPDGVCKASRGVVMLCPLRTRTADI
jgi:uncharacterized protein HemY